MNKDFCEKIINKINKSNVSYFDTLNYILRKGVIPLARFCIFKIFSMGKHKFPSFIGSNTTILNTKYLKTGVGLYLGEKSYIDCLCSHGVNIGARVTIREFAWVQLTSQLQNPGHSINIGDDTYIGPRVNLGAAAPIDIGSMCQIGASVSFVAENHLFDSSAEIFEQGVSRKGIKIGDDCWVGNQVIFLDGVEIGKGSVVAAGAVVTKSFPEYSVIAGVPARLIKSRS